ncbi:hypothetical protein HYC85_030150 [Camellia sinensis]|uniref:Uncharacterized protein n=1 Tax=Camellia sinensis TaxID=4442 RepID=A0A7J7G029_CAMSI|nr:hypothetical protein HYC85_030150 [Camellia sinensis]
MVVVGFVPNEYLVTKLLILYAKAGDLVTAGKVSILHLGFMNQTSHVFFLIGSRTSHVVWQTFYNVLPK